MKEIKEAQVHVHNNRVALWIEGSETVYLTVNQAKGLASALKSCAKAAVNNSNFQTFRIDEKP